MRFKSTPRQTQGTRCDHTGVCELQDWGFQSVWFSNDFKRGFAKGAVVQKNCRPSPCRKQHTLGDLKSSARSQKCLIKNHVKTCQHKCAQKCSSMGVSSQWFNFLQTWIENLNHLSSHVTLGLHSPGGGETSEARKRADLPPHNKLTIQHAELHPSLPAPQLNRTALAPLPSAS